MRWEKGVNSEEKDKGDEEEACKEKQGFHTDEMEGEIRSQGFGGWRMRLTQPDNSTIKYPFA